MEVEKKGGAPQHGHQTDRFNPAPPVDQNGYGQGKNEDRPVHGGNEQAALRVRDSPLQLEKREERNNHQPVHVVKHVKQEQQGKDEIRG